MAFYYNNCMHDFSYHPIVFENLFELLLQCFNRFPLLEKLIFLMVWDLCMFSRKTHIIKSSNVNIKISILLQQLQAQFHAIVNLKMFSWISKYALKYLTAIKDVNFCGIDILFDEWNKRWNKLLSQFSFKCNFFTSTLTFEGK